jgi:hypothetical protein
MNSLKGVEWYTQNANVVFWATGKDVQGVVELNNANLNHDVGGTMVQSTNKKPTTTCQLQTRHLPTIRLVCMPFVLSHR